MATTRHEHGATGAQLSASIEAERQRLLARGIEQANDPAAWGQLHGALVAFRAEVRREVEAALDRGTTAAHDALARATLARWAAGETCFSLASGRQEFELPALPREQAAEVERLASITRITSYEFHREQLGGERERWYSLASLEIGGWGVTCKWHNEVYRYGSSENESWIELSCERRGLELFEEVIEERIETTLDAVSFASFFYLLAFDLLDEHLSPAPRPPLEELLE